MWRDDDVTEAALKPLALPVSWKLAVAWNTQLPQRHCTTITFTKLNDMHHWHSGGASAVKVPGHFEVRKSSIQITRSQGRSQNFTLGQRS